MRMPAFSALALAVSAWAAPCAADVVTEVYDLALRTSRAPAASASPTYTLAIVMLAVFDAANAVEGRFQAYQARPAPPPGASAQVAALAAGCTALAAIQNRQRAEVETGCEAIAAGLPADKATADGRAFGIATGRALLAFRRGDGVGAPNVYRPFAAPGVYVPTALPIGFDVASAKPFAMESPSQFRPGPPPALTSAVWARDFNEVKSTGARAAAQRAPAQTEIALFWASNGPQQFVDSIRDLPLPAGAGVADRARFFALIYMALADAGIAHYDAKYTYNFWRPITAIRNADLDGNDATERDASWLPLIETPMHPEYPCAHCNVSAAVATILASFQSGGEFAVPLTLQSASIPGRPTTKRQWKHVDEVIAEVGDARVWSGVHFRTSTEAGAAMGRALGQWMLANQLRPLAPAR